MAIYCDTSLLVAALTAEHHSETARDWLMRQAVDTLVISDWVMTEFASAISMKTRRGALGADARTAVERQWRLMLDETLTVERVESGHFARAALLTDHLPNRLGAGDALHLAIVLDRSHGLATFDDDLAAAARMAGVDVHAAPLP